MTHRFFPLAAILSFVLAGLPAAAMIVTDSPLPPPRSEVLLGLDGDGGSYLCTHGSAMAVDLGQTFRLARPAELEKITLKVRPASDVAGELVTLLVGTFSAPEDHEMDAVLVAETRGLPASLVPGEVRYLTFDFADLSLEADRQYGFLLGFTGGGNVNDARLDVFHLGGDLYPGGQAVDSGGGFTSALDDDLVFFLHGDPRLAGDALLFHAGRFRVEAAWKTFDDQTGMGVPVALTDASGYFWFFDDSNVELVIKVLDACVDPFDHFWVFVAGLTNVEVTLTVTDTWTGAQKTYVNPLATTFQTILDVEAFATCDAVPP